MFHYFCKECDQTVDDLALAADLNGDDDEVTEAYFYSLCAECYLALMETAELYPVEN